MPGNRHAMDDSQPGQAESAHPDPLQRHVEQVGTNRHTGNKYDVSNEIYSKRHERYPEIRQHHRIRLVPFVQCASTRIKRVHANVDRVDTFQLEIAMNDMFDGTHQLISFSAMPWVVRGI